jgi:hypothetical protein
LEKGLYLPCQIEVKCDTLVFELLDCIPPAELGNAFNGLDRVPHLELVLVTVIVSKGFISFEAGTCLCDLGGVNVAFRVM